MYYVVDMGIDKRLEFTSMHGGWVKQEAEWQIDFGAIVNIYQKVFIPPNVVPLFKPRLVSLWEARLKIPEGIKFGLYVSISCAGFHETWDGYLEADGAIIKLKVKSATDQAAKG